MRTKFKNPFAMWTVPPIDSPNFSSFWAVFNGTARSEACKEKNLFTVWNEFELYANTQSSCSIKHSKWHPSRNLHFLFISSKFTANFLKFPRVCGKIWMELNNHGKCISNMVKKVYFQVKSWIIYEQSSKHCTFNFVFDNMEPKNSSGHHAETKSDI